MKIALYIADDVEQVVLTPETDHEKSLLARFHDNSRALTIRKGSFYACQGGWVRHGDNDESTLFVFHEKVPEAPPVKFAEPEDLS